MAPGTGTATERPGRVTTDRRRGVAERGDQRLLVLGRAPIAERDRGVAGEPLSTRPLERAAAETLLVSRLLQSQELGERRMPAGAECRLGGDRGVAIPRADVLAHVAAERPPADALSELGRD